MKASAGRQGSGPLVHDKQERIDRINAWVLDYKINGTESARLSLLAQFHPFLIKHSKKLRDIYSGVHPWDHVLHEAQIIFCDLLDEFTIGGIAYFNVYMERKLPFRLRYFFVKEIRRRQKHLSHSDEQLMALSDDELPAVDDHADMVINDIDRGREFRVVMQVIDNSAALSDRDRDILVKHLLSGWSHESIAVAYGVSRSRISRVIKLAITKVRKELGIGE